MKTYAWIFICLLLFVSCKREDAPQLAPPPVTDPCLIVKKPPIGAVPRDRDSTLLNPVGYPLPYSFVLTLKDKNTKKDLICEVSCKYKTKNFKVTKGHDFTPTYNTSFGYTFGSFNLPWQAYKMNPQLFEITFDENTKDYLKIVWQKSDCSDGKEMFHYYYNDTLRAVGYGLYWNSYTVHFDNFTIEK